MMHDYVAVCKALQEALQAEPRPLCPGAGRTATD